MYQGQHIIDLPKRIVVGEGVLSQLGTHFKELFDKGGLVYVAVSYTH